MISLQYKRVTISKSQLRLPLQCLTGDFPETGIEFPERTFPACQKRPSGLPAVLGTTGWLYPNGKRVCADNNNGLARCYREAN